MANALLFDIDGTLVNAHGLGSKAFEAAIQDSLGLTISMASTDWLGRTDWEIITNALESAGMTSKEAERSLPVIFSSYMKFFQDYSVKHRNDFQRLPFVNELLERLEGQPLALLTGNVLGAAYIKLDAADVKNCFPFGIGGFGSEERNRSKLFPIALEKASRQYKIDQFDRVFVIGDSHRDIACARANNAVAVAVATGKMSVQELSEYKPDYLFETFEPLDELVRIFTR